VGVGVVVGGRWCVCVCVCVCVVMLVVGCAYFVAADIEEPLQGFDLHEYVYRIVSQKMRKSETTDANPVPICLFVDQYFNLCKRESG